MLEARAEHAIEIDGEVFAITIHKPSVRVWLASGMFQGSQLEAWARSPRRAVEHWTALAKLTRPGS
jgi:hypothetical protein